MLKTTESSKIFVLRMFRINDKKIINDCDKADKTIKKICLISVNVLFRL